MKASGEGASGESASARAEPDGAPAGPVLVEACVDSLAGALAAEEGGADRLELCRELSVGGLSPGRGLATAVRAAVRLPLVWMVRPRPGGFVVEGRELALMEEELRVAAGEGAAGAALGCLCPDGTLDERALERLARAADGLPLVFHRAFDATPDAGAAFAALGRLGFARVLTSGQAPDALAGAGLLARLIARGERPSVLPGGGIRAANVAALLEGTGAREVHSAVVSGRAPRACEVAELVAAVRRAALRADESG